MAYQKHTSKRDVSIVDIHDVAKMTVEEYRDYLRNDIFQVDHHEVLRSAVAGYAFAVTRKQYQILMTYLRTLEPRVGGGVVKE